MNWLLKIIEFAIITRLLIITIFLYSKIYPWIRIWRIMKWSVHCTGIKPIICIILIAVTIQSLFLLFIHKQSRRQTNFLLFILQRRCLWNEFYLISWLIKLIVDIFIWIFLAINISTKTCFIIRIYKLDIILWQIVL